MNNIRRQRNAQRGFTLIEVLVSIAIFAAMSVAAYQVLNQVQLSNQISAQRSARMNELQRAMVIMDNDFRQMALRQVRTAGGDPAAQLVFFGDNLIDSDSKGIVFSRMGWLNPQQQFPRGEVTKVGYRIQDDVLQRVWWRYPDTVAGDQMIVSPLLSRVTDFDVRFYNGKKWLSDWTVKYTLPQAVAITLTLEDYGQIRRVYLTPGSKLQGVSGSDESSDDE